MQSEAMTTLQEEHSARGVALLRLSGVVGGLNSDLVQSFLLGDDDAQKSHLAAGLAVGSALRTYYSQARLHPHLYPLTDDHQTASKEVFDRFYELWMDIIADNDGNTDYKLLNTTQGCVENYFTVITGEPWLDRNEKLSSVILQYVIPSVKLLPDDVQTVKVILASSEVLLSLDCLVELYSATTQYVALPLTQKHLVLTSLQPYDLRRWVRQKEENGAQRNPKWRLFLFTTLRSALTTLLDTRSASEVDECRLQHHIVDNILAVYPARSWTTVFSAPIVRAMDKLLRRPEKKQPIHPAVVLRHHLALDMQILRYCFKLSPVLRNIPHEVVTYISTWLFPSGIDIESIPQLGLRLA